MKHEQSEKYFLEAVEYIPGGVNSPVRAFRSVGMDPVFIQKAIGAYLYDEDNQRYIDYIGSWGPMILGHAYEPLNQCMKEHLEDGISYGLPTHIEVQLAKQICESYEGVEMVRMVNSGTEATMSAIRAARGYTGRNKIIKFEGNYHGHSDGLLVKSGSGTLTFGMPTSPGVPQDIVKNTLVCRYNDISSVKQCVAANPKEIACIILEPIAGNMGLIPAKKSFLKQLREICDQENIILIFDEVISGFRVSYGGAQQIYGITPDMACFGKIIGGGLPVGAYGGKKEIMSVISPMGPVYQAGTLSGNPLAMHLGSTLLNILKKYPEIYDELEEKGAYLEQGMRTILTKYQLPFSILRQGSLLTLFFMDHEPENYDDVKKCNTQLYASYFRKMIESNIMIAPSQFEAMFISNAHTKEDLNKTLQAFDKAMKEIKDESFN
ncbi:MAG: glutamate-1-semialdehyde 2,1-aminomutase [Traorella sp.]